MNSECMEHALPFSLHDLNLLRVGLGRPTCDLFQNTEKYFSIWENMEILQNSGK